MNEEKTNVAAVPEEGEIRMRKLKDFSDGSKRLTHILNGTSILIGIVLWALITLIPSINSFVANPLQVIQALGQEVSEGRYFRDIWASLQRVLVGFSLAMVCAIPVSFLMGWYPKVRALLDPWIQFLRTIPPIALIPMVILAMGLSESAKYTIIFIAVFLVSVVTIYQGIREVDKTLVKAAYTFGARDLDIFLHVMIPASFPFILVAARLGIATALTTLIASEMTGATYGLGARITSAQQFMNISVVMLGIITIGIIGFVLDRVLLLVEKKLTKWK